MALSQAKIGLTWALAGDPGRARACWSEALATLADLAAKDPQNAVVRGQVQVLTEWLAGLPP